MTSLARNCAHVSRYRRYGVYTKVMKIAPFSCHATYKNDKLWPPAGRSVYSGRRRMWKSRNLFSTSSGNSCSKTPPCPEAAALRPDSPYGFQYDIMSFITLFTQNCQHRINDCEYALYGKNNRERTNTVVYGLKNRVIELLQSLTRTVSDLRQFIV